MKQELMIENTRDQTRGFSVLEVLIAMTILILAISTVILVSFGNQSVLSDSQMNVEALNKAQELLEKAQAEARKDFNLVNAQPKTLVTDPGGWTYFTQLDVTNPLDPITNLPDYFTKNVTATISWTGDHNRNLSTSLSALVTNFNNAIGGDTCNSSLSGNWTQPKIANSNTNFASLVNDAGGTYSLSDTDAYKGKLYVTAAHTAYSTDPTLFVFDISTPSSPVLVPGGKVDNAPGTASGLSAIVVAEHPVDNKIYAYVANGYGANFTTCVNANGANTSCGQLQIIDVTSAVPQVVYTFKIPGVSGSGGQGVGNSIFYKDGLIYLGLTTGAGPEFHIIDVHQPTNPVPVTSGVVSVGNTINAIVVKNKYAYLATPNSQELKVFDVSDPANPVPKGGFDAPGGSGNGKSIYAVGDTLYLSRTLGGKEFYALNNTDPANLTANNPNPPAQDINISVDGVIARDYLVFLLTKTNFQIWRLDQSVSPWSISQWSPSFLSLPASGSVIEPSFDCEGNYFYTGSNDNAGHGYLSVITSQ